MIDDVPCPVMLNPAITPHRSKWLSPSTGIRAVDDCVEGFCSLEANPYADAPALRGLERDRLRLTSTSGVNHPLKQRLRP